MNECMLVSVRIGASLGCAGRVGARPKSQQGTYGLCRARWLLIFVVCQVWVLVALGVASGGCSRASARGVFTSVFMLPGLYISIHPGHMNTRGTYG